MKKFEIPEFYRSPIISHIKHLRKDKDPRKKDYSPTKLDFGPVTFYIARHFGFCYGVENAIEIAYKTIAANPDKRIFLISEMIHNPHVNRDLTEQGVKFIMDTDGSQIIDWKELNENDIVIIPAFGTSLETEAKLKEIGVNRETYNTTCPFVEKVWNRAAELGDQDYTVVIHGKHNHEETRATFSHSKNNAPSVIVRDIEEAKLLGEIILERKPAAEFYKLFAGRYSNGFDPEKHLNKVGVVNQTTMLASETEEITDYFREVMIEKYGIENIDLHFADTRDTLCYATNDNQKATYGLLRTNSDLAIVVGGYNSSNTTHIVELLEGKFPTYFISSDEKIISPNEILHFNITSQKEELTEGYLPVKKPVNIVVTSGASCPDSLVDRVLLKILSFYKNVKNIDEVLRSLTY